MLPADGCCEPGVLAERRRPGVRQATLAEWRAAAPERNVTLARAGHPMSMVISHGSSRGVASEVLSRSLGRSANAIVPAPNHLNSGRGGTDSRVRWVVLCGRPADAFWDTNGTITTGAVPSSSVVVTLDGKPLPPIKLRLQCC